MSSLRHVKRRRSKGLAAAVVLALLLPAIFVFAAPGGAVRFAADGDFREWEGVPGVRDVDPAGLETPAPELIEIRVSLQSRALFVLAEGSQGWFEGEGERVLRVFVDEDRSALTGFDLGAMGADLMLEAAGENGQLAAFGTFMFEAGRSRDDWHGWLRTGQGTVAVRGDLAEAAFSIAPESDPLVMVAVSSARGDDLQDPVTGQAGALLAAQATALPPVIAAAGAEAPLVSLELAAAGKAAEVRGLTFAATGAANFSVLAGARLTLDDREAVATADPTGASLSFTFDPPLALPLGVHARATLRGTFGAGRDFDRVSGMSFGARLTAADTGQGGPSLAATPRTLAPSSYLGYISSAPVVDGAFGEWRLAGAAADPLDADAAPGGDLLGVRALTSGGKGAFFAETRGPILEGASLRDLPHTVELAASGGPSAPRTPTPEAAAPPLTADDRLLVYLDTDRDPATGFAPAVGGPIGAEYVVQVAGRFSSVSAAHVLRFAGSAPYESAWEPVGEVKAIAAGANIEGEIPELAFAETGAARILIQTATWSGRTSDLSDVLQDAAISPVDPDNLLHFRAVTFDPLAGKPAVRPALLTDEPNGFWVVQLGDVPSAGARAELEAAGATLYGYVHSNAYLAKMDAEQAATVRTMDEVRWVGIYQPAFKFPADPATWGEGVSTYTALLFEKRADLAERVEAAGAELISASDASLRIGATGSTVEALAFIPEIQYIEPEHKRVPLNDIGRNLSGVNLAFDHHGLDGTGIVVGISDSGIDFTHPAFDDSGTSSPNFDGRIVGFFKYGGSYGDFDGHGTHTAGTVAGDGDLSSTVNASIPGGGGATSFRGMAPAAMLVATVLFNAGAPAEDGLFADQEAFGATVSSNSWGYSDAQNNPVTNYDIPAYLTDLAVIDSNTSRSGLQAMTIVFAAGNDGSGANTVSSPGTSKNSIVVGASETNRGIDDYSDNAASIAVFSSRGPTDDGRIRPDVVAVGTYVLSTQSRTPGCTCSYGWDLAPTGANYAYNLGTSMSTPMVAGIVALFQQHINETYGRIPSPALVKAALINGAEDLGYGYEFTGGVTGPMSQGWGRVNLTRSIDGPPGGTILLYDEGPSIGTGDVVVRRFTVANASTPLKITTVWTDAPGNPQDSGGLSELINDLDLVVRAPNGTFYHGNQFGGAWSRLNNTSYDRKNNVENVFVQTPGVGTWTVEVSGNLVRSAVQRYALAVSGNMSALAPAGVADAHAVPGAPANSRFGWNATATGSINGDAYNDLVVGAPGANGGNGSVYIFFGGASASFANFNVSLANVTLLGAAAEGFGSSLDASGDFDNDGKNDLLIGAPSGGKAYLFKGGASWASRTPDITFNGSSSALFGAAVRLAAVDSAVGADALVGAPFTSNSTGTLYLFTGGATTGTWNASSANAWFSGPRNGSRLGTSISAGDADGDSKLDIAVGAPGASIVQLIHGGAAAGSLAVNATVTGIPGTAFGHSVAMGGDVNGDGKADVVIGAPLANASAGAGYVFFGRSPLANEQVIRYYFFDDMEAGAGLWQEMNVGANGSTSWSLTTSTFYGDGPSGTSWQEASGAYAVDLDISIAFKDGVSLSSATSPVLSFVYKADLEEYASNYDGFMVLYSTNSGSTWTQLDSSNTQGHYDALGFDPSGPPSGNTAITDKWAFTYDRFAWRQVTFNISSLAGSSSVKFRFEFVSDQVAGGDGIYIDSVAIREANPSSPNYTVYGESAGDLLGYSVASLGDASGDGRAEFAFGAPEAWSGLTESAGAAYVFQGAASLNGSTGVSGAAEILQGSTTDASLGFSLAPMSGVNGSSQTFLFAGSPGLADGSGGGSVGNASAPIPEFSDLAVPVAAVALFGLIGRRKRRHA